MSPLAEIEAMIHQLPVGQQEELLQRLAIKLEDHSADDYPVRNDHVRLLNERFAVYRQDPSQASTWEEVKQRFENDRRG